jgi:hypothetical protein
VDGLAEELRSLNARLYVVLSAGQHPTKRRTRTSPLPAPDRRCRAWAIISRVAAPELSRTCLGEREPRCPPGKNEALFREVNERLQTLKEGFATITDTFEILCECALLECFDHIAMAPPCLRGDVRRCNALRGPCGSRG